MTNDNDLLVVEELAKPVPYNTKKLFENIDAVVQQAIDAGDPEIAFRAGQTLVNAQRLSGMGLARLLFKVKINWNSFNLAVPFEDVAYQYLELDHSNINRYIRVVEMLESGEVPELVKEKLEQMPIRELVPIATTAAGYDISDDNWEKLVESANLNEIQETLREIKGAPPRTNSLVIRMERDGTLRSYPGGHFVGYLEIKSDESLVEKAVRRILNAAGIIEE